jgi:hypothetical protein
MRAKLLLAAIAVALLAGTAAASAQDANIRIQSRDFRESNDLGNHGYYRGYRAYGWAPGYYVGPRYRYRYWRHW